MQSRLHQSHTYPLEEWRISETSFDIESNLLDETLFAQGNGYIGLRGAHEEGFALPAGKSLDGTYLNGFYETESIHYPENAFGLARTKEFMLNVPNGKCIELLIEDERFDILQGKLMRYHRSLDLRTGIGTRTIEWESPNGRQVSITSQRIVCFQNKHLFAIRYEVKPLNFRGKITLISALDGRVKNVEAGDDPRVGTSVTAPPLEMLGIDQSEDFCALVHRTRNSAFTLICANENQVITTGESEIQRDPEQGDQRVGLRYTVTVETGQSVTLTKYGAYISSRDYPVTEVMPLAKQTLTEARGIGFDALCAAQNQYLEAFWHNAVVEIEGDEALQQGLRFNQFHLLQSVGRDGKTNIAAKGVTGEGYEGHYFWDTEIYIFPFFLFTKPDIARKLLEYRYTGLPKARERARQMSHAKGALYPWRTIAGEECSSYFPAGTAQYHINADIAYSIKLYYEITGDIAYMTQYGAEIVMETARIWLGIGSYMERMEGQFGIFEVTGPDEYTACVNNNFYTNAMAQMHLRFAADIADQLRISHPEDYQRIEQAMGLEADEPLRWRNAAENMHLPYDHALGIHPQDDSFLAKPVWDFENTPKENYPLLLHYHPLVIYRHQVCKQADVVLALLLLGNLFTKEEKKRDFDYYDKVTTHDSSLSSCIFSIIASEVGYQERAYQFFMETARMDLDNCHGNTEYGVHTAAMAGAWLGVVYGFAGMRLFDGKLQFAPTLPQQWKRYSFRVGIHGSQLAVNINKEEVEYRLTTGEAIEFQHGELHIHLSAQEPTQRVSLLH